MTAKVSGLIVGLGFGFVISWAGLTDPTVIRNMLLLREPHVFLLMGSAVLVAGAGVRLLRLARLRSFITRESIDWSPVPVQPRHIAGSALFGAGWSVACTCPGPVAAMIGQGHLTGLAVGAGLLAGIALKNRVEARSALGQPGDTPHAACL
jgi:uncharacterized membrane protein YedE/YeeE